MYPADERIHTGEALKNIVGRIEFDKVLGRFQEVGVVAVAAELVVPIQAGLDCLRPLTAHKAGYFTGVHTFFTAACGNLLFNFLPQSLHPVALEIRRIIEREFIVHQIPVDRFLLSVDTLLGGGNVFKKADFLVFSYHVVEKLLVKDDPGHLIWLLVNGKGLHPSIVGVGPQSFVQKALARLVELEVLRPPYQHAG